MRWSNSFVALVLLMPLRTSAAETTDWDVVVYGGTSAGVAAAVQAARMQPHVAEAVFNDMLKSAGAVVVYGERLDLEHGVAKDGARIVSITMESGRVLRAKAFVDASWEGDLLAKAGVKYVVGRESNSVYGE